MTMATVVIEIAAQVRRGGDACELDEQVVHPERTWFPPSEPVAVVACGAPAGATGKGGIESGAADGGSLTWSALPCGYAK